VSEKALANVLAGRILRFDEEAWKVLSELAKRKGLTPAEAVRDAIKIDTFLVSLVLDRDMTICVLPREEGEHVDELRYNSWLRENAPERQEDAG
jgi:hypothetical protein